jgi:DNA adenine methylase
LNINLISLYKNIQSDPQMFIQEMAILVNSYKSITNELDEPNRKPTTLGEAMTSQESYYYWIRSQFNKLPPDLRSSQQASAMFLFLNKTCFRGLYREGPNGFNVPFGHYKNPSIIDEEQIITVSALIQNVAFRCLSFSESLVCQKDDFVYMDPPYVPINATSFVGYNVDGFDSSKHEELFGLCKELKKNDVKMMLSNADVPLVRAAFSEYTTDIISCRRAINSKNPESRTNEVLIVNY